MVARKPGLHSVFRIIAQAILVTIVAVAVAVAVAGAASASATPCSDILSPIGPPAPSAKQEPRRISARDLVGLLDIGFNNGAAADSPFGISPDGRRIAFVLTRAEPNSNTYCMALVVMDLRPGATPKVIDHGTELALVSLNVRGLITPTGAPATITPVWSPDGKWIAYLKQVRGITQIWRVRDDGSENLPATRSDVDIDRFIWSEDGKALLYSSRPELRAAEHARDIEGRGGHLYDDRWFPYNGSRPSIRASTATTDQAVDIATGFVRAATVTEQRVLHRELASDRPAQALSFAIAHDRRRAWTVKQDPSRFVSAVELWAEPTPGETIKCGHPACMLGHRNIEGLWWASHGPDLLFLRREGWGDSALALYRWTPGATAPRRIFATEDVLEGCRNVAMGLVCARDSSLKPRRLVIIDTRTGVSRLLFDPNPEFAAIRLGTVERLHWQNDIGFECYGDLVLPPDYRAGQRVPLIVVQYRTRGFLRGGVGDEYPIQALAARGFAILSVENPPPFYLSLPQQAWRTSDEAAVENVSGWRERRSVLSSVVAGVARVVSLGIADPKRIGITGVSEGAASARFALINTRLFAAASISTCCVDQQTAMIYSGPAVADSFKRLGYLPLTGEDPSFWRPFSLADNAREMAVPLLMQIADREYLTSLEAYTLLREHRQPVEMYVFEDEYHIKWQPAHRLAIYERNLDWFDFWLMHRKAGDPSKVEQYRRWGTLAQAAADQKR